MYQPESPTLMDLKRRKAVMKILATIVAVTVLAVGLYFILMKLRYKCELSSSTFEFELNKLKNIASSDNLALVNLAGHVGFVAVPRPNESEDKIFMPFKVVTVELEHMYNGQQLNVMSECVKLSFVFSHSDLAGETFVSHIMVEVVLANEIRRVCTIKYPQIYYGNGKHYSCKTIKSYECEAPSEEDEEYSTVSIVNFDILEFETNGNMTLIKQGKFSTSEHNCM